LQSFRARIVTIKEKEDKKDSWVDKPNIMIIGYQAGMRSLNCRQENDDVTPLRFDWYCDDLCRLKATASQPTHGVIAHVTG